MPASVVSNDEVSKGVTVSSERPGTGSRQRKHRGFDLQLRDWKLQSMITLSVLACLVTTFVIYPHHRYHFSLDGALYLVASTAPIIPMVLVGRRFPTLRRPWQYMAAGVALNAVANVIFALHDQLMKPVPNPAPSDVFYLLSYCSFIIGVALLTQGSFGGVRLSVRLDGVIAGLAVASLVSFAWFSPLQAAGGSTIHIVVDLAYPMFDLVMLVWLVAALAPQRFRPNLSTGLLIAGVLWFIVGDVIHVNQLAANSTSALSFADVTFVIGIWLMGLAASAQDRRNVVERSALSGTSLSVAVPVVSGAIAIGVIAARWLWNRPPEVGGLALAALALVVGRMWLALRVERRLVLSTTVDARTDSLTNLPNRRYLFERIDELLRLEKREHVGVILIDLDGFKEVNDTLGHAVGDSLLSIISHRFAARLGGRGILTRLGGDEFAAICICSEVELVTIAMELLSTTREPYAFDGLMVTVGASMGIAVADGDTEDPYQLLHRADKAMYEAKRTQCGIRVSQSPSAEQCSDRYDSQVSTTEFEASTRLRLASQRDDSVAKYQVIDHAFGWSAHQE